MRQFKFRSSGMGGTTANMVMAVVMICVGGFMLTVVGAGGILVGVGILLLIMQLWNQGRAVVTLHDDHLEMKVAPLAARHLIRYGDISEIDELGANKVFLVTGGKRIRLPLAILEPDEQPELLEELRRRSEKQ
jgi:hypothetical protein